MALVTRHSYQGFIHLLLPDIWTIFRLDTDKITQFRLYDAYEQVAYEIRS